MIAGTVGITYFVLRLFRNFMARPILEIHLSPIHNPKWTDLEKIRDLIDSFETKGFRSAGDYECSEIPSLIISGFVYPSQQMTGIIYDHPTGSIWVDIVVQYSNGGSLTVSNAPIGHSLDHMPQQEKFYLKESSVDELLEKIQAERKEAGGITITKEEFSSNFEEQYQKEMRWRADRGGPTYLEIRTVAEKNGVHTDRERLEQVKRKIQDAWMREKKKPKKVRSVTYLADLPEKFQRPDEFRLTMEQKSGAAPLLSVPVFPVYLILFSAIAYWCYFGYQYNKTHFPISLIALVIFFVVFLILFLIAMLFRNFNRSVRMYPVLRRIASQQVGAFLFIQGNTPILFYARETWIGKVRFDEGGEGENACTYLEARIKQSLPQLSVYRKGVFAGIFTDKDQNIVQLPESDFSRKFEVWSTEEEFARRFLNEAIRDRIIRLADISNPSVNISGSYVHVEVSSDFFKPSKEATLKQFLSEAEIIIGSASQEK
ncbi:MAG: DUF3137 domain-containing protein [Thermodesulfovibrionales bacterium]|nr:DUF3137 domain-containing protein [Thermodesulfovibrionales bacterium]